MVELYGKQDVALKHWLDEVVKKRCPNSECKDRMIDASNHLLVLLHGGFKIEIGVGKLTQPAGREVREGW